MSGRTDAERSELEGLRRRLVRAEAEAAEALFGRAAADHRTHWALTLFAAVSRVWEARGVDALYEALDEIAVAVLDGRPVGIYVRAPDCAELRLVHSSLAIAPAAPIAILGEDVVGRAAAERRVIRGVASRASDPILAVPLGAPPRVIGSLVLYAGFAGPTLDPDQLQFVEIVGRHAGNALHVLSPVAGFS